MSQIYFMKAAGVPLVKVGKADDAMRRIKEHQCGCPLRLTLLHVESAAASTERRIHKILGPYRAHSEWFDEEAVSQFLTLVRGVGIVAAVSAAEAIAEAARLVQRNRASRVRETILALLGQKNLPSAEKAFQQLCADPSRANVVFAEYGLALECILADADRLRA